MKSKCLGLIVIVLLALAAGLSVRAQEEAAIEVENQNPRRAARPFKIMQELGLSRGQIQDIRRINQARRPIMQSAAQRWHTARRNLDEAIYADDATEEQIKELIDAAQLAQSELLRERTLTEYMIRRVLTPEQLDRFRRLREQLMPRGKSRRETDDPENAGDDAPRPFNRFSRRKRNRGQ
ncbi:MAG TPA: Spy/CpxP family protein refolding chaperone [Pyrinomonadaceae bacterium]